MAEERLRRNLEMALDPGPDFPSHQWLSRTMAALESEAHPRTRARGPAAARGSLGLAWRGRRLAAVVVVIALAAAATAGFLAIHSKFSLSTVHGPRFQVKNGGAPACAVNCTFGTSVFTSEKVGWVSEWRQSSCTTVACREGPTQVVAELFVTTDGGNRWRPTLSLGNHSVEQILASPDGANVLVVGAPYDPAPALFRSEDGGRTWLTLPYPAGTASFKSDSSDCPRVAPHAFFLNPAEGWVIAQTHAYASAQIFHTNDGGVHWALTGSFDIKSQLNVDVVSGLQCKFTITHELPGDFQFENSTAGWYVPYDPNGSTLSALLYRTRDGGLNWRPISIAVPTDAFHYAARVASLTFFSPEAGAAVVSEVAGSATGYVFQTTDGGAHWGNPVIPPVEGPIQLIDATHWVGWPYGGGWMRTSDAGQHWEVVRRVAATGDDSVRSNSGLPCCPHPGRTFQFLNPSFGVAYVQQQGGGVSLYMTSNGGMNWTPVSLPDWG